METLRQFIYNQHDVICNQKYGDNLPYSFHLKSVESQGKKFINLLQFGRTEVRMALIAHDTIEDARLTYNDLVEIFKKHNPLYFSSPQELQKSSETAANIVYTVTDEKGKNRAERKNEKYYKELKANPLAVFVKLADISANTLYSKLTGSSMYEKYKKEFPDFKEKVYLEEYKEFFDYLESL